VGGAVFTRRLTEPAQARLSSGHEAHEHGDDIRSKAAWADAASYAIADLTMLRRELVIGYLVAGVLAETVSHDVWNAVFFEGHGFWTTLENVALGPFIAFVSFVCSIGNVPMAAALWHGGISFGGVISFIFADLIALPLVLIYRKYYGTRLAMRLTLTFWAVMSLAGLIVEGIFWLFGAVPENRPTEIVATHFQWNYTTFLNIFFLGAFAVLYWLYRNRARLGGGAEHATDPTCGMQVRKSNAPASRVVDGERFYFCSDGCRERFEATRVKG
ncbi:MAG: permease, partial [Acidimicrobiia bacterium]|nr:permease [Acidimicrobiia bacterium]